MPMAEFDADKLNEGLKQLNDKQLATMEKLVEELLEKMTDNQPAPKRAGESKKPSEAA